MKVYSKMIKVNGLANIEVIHDLGIEISHNGRIYSLAVDNLDRLILRSIDMTQIILFPQSSNSVEIKSV